MRSIFLMDIFLSLFEFDWADATPLVGVGASEGATQSSGQFWAFSGPSQTPSPQRRSLSLAGFVMVSVDNSTASVGAGDGVGIPSVPRLKLHARVASIKTAMQGV